MNRTEEILKQLKDIASNPKKAMDDFKNETGKGAIGIMPLYAPEELVYATGRLPMGIWGGTTQISNARTYLAPFACSIMQAVMELECSGTYDDLEAVIFSTPCDTLKDMSQKWKGKCSVIVFTHPQNRALEAANTYLVEEYKIVKEKLEEVTGTQITNSDIEKAIVVYNENKAVMREFSKVAADYPQIIDPIARHAVFKSRMFMDKAKHTVLVKELIEELKKNEVEPWNGKKAILTGILAEPDELLEIMKENGIAVIADDLAQESRQIRVDVPEGDASPLYRLAKVWQNMYGCSVATDPKKYRGQMLINMVKQTDADAVIICMMKFCEPEEFDYPVYFKQFNKEGIKSLMIEIDMSSNSFEQTRTRIQSFTEML
ncbi:MAG: 2-hydroxyacyl-CoA dehydratase family protein [Clostridiales bacterium]|nr:2-hydroxyacyl-CoA dehydratase family protein [Clostridiales bacterium]